VNRRTHLRSSRPSRGFTLIELVVTLTLVSVLAMVAVPMYEVTVTRAKESELRTALRQIRNALDAYKAATDTGVIAKTPGSAGYPPDLTTLVQGVDTILTGSGAQGLVGSAGVPAASNPFGLPAAGGNGAAGAAGAPGSNASGNGAAIPDQPPTHMVFLRSVPRDPFFEDQTVAPEQQWNIRAYGSPPGDFSSGSEVYDVSSKSAATGKNGIAYKDW
jgi:general secretion pathway protein G